MKLQLIDDVRGELRRLWTIRVAAFWIFVGAFVMVAPLVSDAAQSLVGPWTFGGTLFVAAVSFGLARFLKQPGTSE